ncbi:MAG: MBL fold metallo-hydrolase [Gemmatimonadota bacterium]|nr:MBL fold metallo-hydrolase [Gemmatimonadota bacterium]
MRALRAVGIAAVLLAVGATGGALAQEPDVSIEVVPVAGNVVMLHSGVAGNVGVSSGTDGVLMVDDKIAPLAEELQAALAGVSEQLLVFLLNTHWHHDHTGTNPAFGPEALIVAHDNVRKRLSTDQRLGERTFEAMPPEGLPVLTFDRSLSIHFNGEEIRAIHLPRGHTDGDVAVWFTESNVIHMGDQFFNGIFPFVDLATGGDVEGFTANVAKVLEKIPADAAVIPGHGPLGTVEDLREFHRMLVETTGFVRDAIAAGSSLEEIRAEGLPAEWEGWAWEFISEETWIGIVHASLTRSEDTPESSHGH